MNPEQIQAVRSFLRALGIPTEREARILAACRDVASLPNALITTRAAAAILECHPKTLFRYRHKGVLHSVKRSPRCIRWRKSEVEALANGGVVA